MNDEAARQVRPATNSLSAADDTTGSGEQRTRTLRARLETDPEMAEFCRLARRLRDRMVTP